MVNILKKTKNYITINKPAGILVHTDGRSDESTVVDWVRENHPEIIGVGETLQLHDGTIIDRPGIVHRLDRDTSGVLLIARTQEMFDHLKSQFKKHTIKKTYHAIVYGNIKEESGIIDEPIGKSKKDFRRWHAGRGTRGTLRDAVTEFKVLHRFENNGEQFTYVELYPKTGRTHQLRVHMKYMNHPIVADELYGGKRFEKSNNLGFERQALHAHNIEFHDLEDGIVQVEAAPPNDFTAIKMG